MSPNPQRKLVLDDAPPLSLATIETARHELPGHDEDDIVALIEEGFIAFAWNIALSTSGARETRIWPACIDHYKRTLGRLPFDAPESVVISDLVRAVAGDKPFVLGSKLRLALNCSSTHIINLIGSKQLILMPGVAFRRGPGGSPLITVPSLQQFLSSSLL
jgi:hypothetical protein